MLGHVGVLVGGVRRPLDVGLVDQAFDALLNHADGRREAGLGLTQNLKKIRLIITWVVKKVSTFLKGSLFQEGLAGLNLQFVQKDKNKIQKQIKSTLFVH